MSENLNEDPVFQMLFGDLFKLFDKERDMDLTDGLIHLQKIPPSGKNLSGVRGGFKSVYPFVNINPQGQLNFNVAATARYLVGAKHAEVFYNPKYKALVVKPLTESTKTSYAFSINKAKTKNATLAVKALLKRYGVLKHIKSLNKDENRFGMAWSTDVDGIVIYLV